MFDMFTSRNVKKIFKYPLSCPTTMSDQIVGLRECVDSQICRTFWEEYVVDTLGVYCNDYLFEICIIAVSFLCQVSL
jgi:hypothetical protein